MPSIYFSHQRKCLRRHSQWLPASDLLPPKPNEQVTELRVRVRTIGDIISTGMIESPADSVEDIIAEISAARLTERGSRADDKTSEAAMEDRKKPGYCQCPPPQLFHHRHRRPPLVGTARAARQRPGRN